MLKVDCQNVQCISTGLQLIYKSVPTFMVVICLERVTILNLQVSTFTTSRDIGRSYQNLFMEHQEPVPICKEHFPSHQPFIAQDSWENFVVSIIKMLASNIVKLGSKSQCSIVKEGNVFVILHTTMESCSLACRRFSCCFPNTSIISS